MKQFGNVISCIILKDKGKSRGFGFVTFTKYEVAEEVSRLYHSIRGKEFGCNLIMPNKEARSHQADKKNRKIYIKTTDKSALVKWDVMKIFEVFGEISEITILRESKERSGFITFKDRETVDRIMKNPDIPYRDGSIICEPCLSRKEIKKHKNPLDTMGGSKRGDHSMVSSSNYHHHDYYNSYEEAGYEEYDPHFEGYGYNYHGSDSSPGQTPYFRNEEKPFKNSSQNQSKKTKKGRNEYGFNIVQPEYQILENYEENLDTWPAEKSGQEEQQFLSVQQPKPRYFIEVRDVSGLNNLQISDFEKSNSEINSVRQIKEEVSKDCFDKSPKHSAEEEQGKHFLNVPNFQARSIHKSDNLALPPKLNDFYESGSIKEPMITTGQLNKLFFSDDEDNDTKVKKVASHEIDKHSSKKEMLSSKASRSNSQEFIESEKAKLNYRINQEKAAADRRRSYEYEADLLMPPQSDDDLRPRQRSLNEIRMPSPQREKHLGLKIPEEVKSFDGNC